MLIHQQAHELRDSEHRVGVVELNGVVVREACEVVAVVLEVVVDHLLQRGRDEEVLLAHAQDLALVRRVVGVEHATDVHDAFALDDGVSKALGVESVVIEFVDGLGLPQTQRTHVVRAVTGNRHVVGDGADIHVVEVDAALARGAAHDEVVAVFHPGVRLFLLVAVVERLAEQAVAIEQTVAGHWVILRDGGIEEARSKAAQATVAQRGIVLGLEDVGELAACGAGGGNSVIDEVQVG